jgi:hypothetical protein
VAHIAAQVLRSSDALTRENFCPAPVIILKPIGLAQQPEAHDFKDDMTERRPSGVADGKRNHKQRKLRSVKLKRARAIMLHDTSIPIPSPWPGSGLLACFDNLTNV